MGRVLKHSVLVRKNPPVGELVLLEAGQELPDWAEGRVGEHVFEDGKAEEAKTTSAPKPSLPKRQPEVEPEPEKLEVPHRGAHHTKWRKFLESVGVDVPTGTSREEMIEIAEEKHPDIEIPDDEE